MAMGQKWMEVVANNLANAGTTGYKRDDVSFEESLQVTLRANGGTGKVIGQVQNGPNAARLVTTMDQGNALLTGNSLDLMIDAKEGMFAVQTANGTRYTRNGSFELKSDGTLTTKSGDPVLDTNNNPIQLPPGNVKFGRDGTVSVDDRRVAQLGIFEGRFNKRGDSLYEAETAPTLTAAPTVIPGAVEASNVNTIQEMVDLVRIQRTYEMAQKTVQQHDELTQALIQKTTGG